MGQQIYKRLIWENWKCFSKVWSHNVKKIMEKLDCFDVASMLSLHGSCIYKNKWHNEPKDEMQ